MARFCHECGAELREGARFCPSCGTPALQEEPQTGQPQFEEQQPLAIPEMPDRAPDIQGPPAGQYVPFPDFPEQADPAIDLPPENDTEKQESEEARPIKVLIINGSPREDGNSARLIKEATDVFDSEGIGYEVYQVGSKAIRGCVACGYCGTNGECIFKDDVNDLAKKLEESDGLLVVSPVYYASANGTVVALLDRLFYSSHCDKRMKVGAAFAVARRAGTTATFDELNKYFTINQMPVASGRYWNNGFGREKGETAEDAEGLQNARIVARNMVFLMRSIALGKEKYGLPETEQTAKTDFIEK